MVFNKLYKKRGFHETIFILYSAKNYSLILPIFFEKLEEIGSYYNAFFRVKDELTKYELIEYKKNRQGEKIISLTERGLKLARILKRIEMLMELPYEEYKRKVLIIEKRKKARAKSRRKNKTAAEN